MNRKYLNIIAFLFLLLTACEKEKKDNLIPYPNDITFDEQGLADFSFKIPGTGFKAGNAESGFVNINSKVNPDGSFSGFAVSNKNWRSYPWNLSPDFAPVGGLTAAQKQSSIDSTIFSTYTLYPNKTGNFLVARTRDDAAFITLEQPTVVEHILVSNTSYNYLLATYGSNYSGTLDNDTQSYLLSGTKVKNIQIANTSTTRYGRFNLPGPNNSSLINLAGDEVLAKRKAGKAAADASRSAGKSKTEVAADSTAAATAVAKGYIKLTITGSRNGQVTGTREQYLAVRLNVDAGNKLLNFTLSDWQKVALNGLGVVDKLVFRISSSYTDNAGNDLTPPYFCLDGIRLRKN